MQLGVIEIFIEFILFAVMQAFFINGVFESCRGGCVNDTNKGRVCTGNIIYKINPKWFEKHKHEYYAKPFFGCIRCMGSFWGALTFWPLAIYFYGFHWEEIPVYIFDVFTLTTLNWWVYKRL